MDCRKTQFLLLDTWFHCFTKNFEYTICIVVIENIYSSPYTHEIYEKYYSMNDNVQYICHSTHVYMYTWFIISFKIIKWSGRNDWLYFDFYLFFVDKDKCHSMKKTYSFGLADEDIWIKVTCSHCGHWIIYHFYRARVLIESFKIQ